MRIGATRRGKEELKESIRIAKETQIRAERGSRRPKGTQWTAKRGPREAQEGPKESKSV